MAIARCCRLPESLPWTAMDARPRVPLRCKACSSQESARACRLLVECCQPSRVRRGLKSGRNHDPSSRCSGQAQCPGRAACTACRCGVPWYGRNAPSQEPPFGLRPARLAVRHMPNVPRKWSVAVSKTQSHNGVARSMPTRNAPSPPALPPIRSTIGRIPRFASRTLRNLLNEFHGRLAR